MFCVLYSCPQTSCKKYKTPLELYDFTVLAVKNKLGIFNINLDNVKRLFVSFFSIFFSQDHTAEQYSL